MSASPGYSDPEKGSIENVQVHPAVEASPEAAIVQRYGVLGTVMAKMFASGVEARGVERVPEDERETKNTWNK